MVSSKPVPFVTESPILRFGMTLVVLVLIVAVAGRYFNQVFDDAEHTEALAAIAAFTSSLTNIHQRWILQGRPSQVKMHSLNAADQRASQRFFIMNAEGWPIHNIAGSDKPDCEALWVALQPNQRLSFAGVALKMRLTGSEQPLWVCQMMVAEQWLFRYRLDNGKVESINQQAKQ